MKNQPVNGVGDNELPVIPLKEKVIFPGIHQPVIIGRTQSLKALEAAQRCGNNLILVAQKNAEIKEPGPEDIFKVGTRAVIVKYIRHPNNTVQILVNGQTRVKILRYIQTDPLFIVEYEDIHIEPPIPETIENLINQVKTVFQGFTRVHPKIPRNVVDNIDWKKNPEQYLDTIASLMPLKLNEAQNLLETTDFLERLEKVHDHIVSYTELVKLEQKLQGRIKNQVETTQKQWYLHEQLKAIQKELGKENVFQSDISELKNKVDTIPLSKEAKEKTLRELKRLELMQPMNPEANVSRDYIGWILSLPWKKQTRDRLDLERSRRMLDEDHYGLEKIKERIIEYLAVRKHTRHNKGPILCFVGPPGVGKTSLAQSISRTTGRKFVRLSLGGIRDEAEIRGHRRTYIGALPGRIIQSIRKAGSMNPVFLLDEVDKMGTDFRGDPSAALLEVLDPEQNHAFSDHYLEIGFDLSRVMFITTANTSFNIPPPLLDRMEILQLTGYTEDEKIMIARHFLIPKQLSLHGLRPGQVKFTGNVLQPIIRKYTREAGVRNLEREIATICRKITTKIVNKELKNATVKVTTPDLKSYLGIPRINQHDHEATGEIGVSIALAWTEYGGDTLQVETVVIPGTGKLTLTGQLGEIMQESAKAALSYVRSKASMFGLNARFHEKFDIHIHVPEGAIPKDGPSAGIAIATSLISAISKNPVRKNVAMTGEITIRGRILPVGGIKEKILTANRSNVKKVLIPKENKKYLDEIPRKILNQMDIIPVKTMDEVLVNTFCKKF